ncbi:unnamed protein product [Pleuronectes platessa]|uniref:Uncharacterized protein n=1 Tax=Pleuronectes platessa TaxID=8262 RepID=A0A9N7TMW2_PLEPL|nr:unnamed protein product [Pleuronectes platessa]
MQLTGRILQETDETSPLILDLPRCFSLGRRTNSYLLPARCRGRAERASADPPLDGNICTACQVKVPLETT